MDLIDFKGPTFAGMDNRLAALRLVQGGLCDAALFDSAGESWVLCIEPCVAASDLYSHCTWLLLQAQTPKTHVTGQSIGQSGSCSQAARMLLVLAASAANGC